MLIDNYKLDLETIHEELDQQAFRENQMLAELERIETIFWQAVDDQLRYE